MTPSRPPRHAPIPLPAAWALAESCALPLALADRAGCLAAVNPALHDWLAAGPRPWRGVALAELDTKPPQLRDALARAFAEQRRVWLRAARLRSALGDRAADLVLTPLDAGHLLLEVQPIAVAPALRLSESLRGFAHEIRGPLAGVRGAAQLLQRRLNDPEMAELAQLIVAEADRLAALSDRLLNAGAKPHLARVNIHEVVERVAALLSAEPDAPRIRRDYDPSLPPLAADADRLQQACLNLARNAAEAGAHTLSVRTRVEHGARLGGHGPRYALRVDFADDGRGVPAELADTLFEPLVSGRADGTGLGLAIAREIAREHGGELGYASRPGATVFTLLLPLGEAEP